MLFAPQILRSFSLQPPHIVLQSYIGRVRKLTDNIDERAIKIAQYIIETGATVRAAGARFGISKSTVHKDISERLARASPLLRSRVRDVLDFNKAERHIRGGEATRVKYQSANGKQQIR
jgi:putative DeoR family transcriptional regulator (stage III sporulation protein D)